MRIDFGWRLGSSRSGYALQRRHAVASRARETLYSGPVESPCAHPFALGCTCAAKSSVAFQPRSQSREWPEKHTAHIIYSRRIAVSRMRPFTVLESAKFARFRAFAMLRQSLAQLRIDACRCMTMAKT